MNNSLYFLLGWGAPIGAAIFAFVLVRSINRRDAGTEKMQQIAALIRSGAMAFLRTEYQWLAVFVAVMFVILVAFLPENALWIGVSFLVGAVLSATAGWWLSPSSRITRPPVIKSLLSLSPMAGSLPLVVGNVERRGPSSQRNRQPSGARRGMPQPKGRPRIRSAFRPSMGL